jgi:hypothetical protein
VAGKHPEQKVGDIQKVVMYSRIGYSINPSVDSVKFELQEEAMRKFCEEHQLEIKSSYREVAPGTLDLWSRPMLDKALDELKWSRKEKSVLLVSKMDRLTKRFDVIVKLLDDYNPKFLSVSLGLRYDTFLFTIQAATAEEEFRQKYGKLYNTTSCGLQAFYNQHKFFTKMWIEHGKTPTQIAEENNDRFVPIPRDLHWTEETINNILKFGVDK